MVVLVELILKYDPNVLLQLLYLDQFWEHVRLRPLLDSLRHLLPESLDVDDDAICPPQLKLFPLILVQLVGPHLCITFQLQILSLEPRESVTENTFQY